MITDSKGKINFDEGQILLVDKPLTWSSFAVVNKLRYPLRRFYNKKKFKVGHAGTLDPLATGLLVICTGKMTKQITGFIQDEKGYEGVIKLGASTPSYDLETEIDATFPIDHITPELIEETRLKFLGEQLQTPPIFSAKKIDGKRAYESARAGVEVKMKQSLISINSLEMKLEGDEIHFKTECTKGTYIRSLAYDFGKALNSGAHLTALRRTKSGAFDIKDSKTIEEWMEVIENQATLEKKEV